MIINHNIAALNTYRALSNNNVLANKSLEKLSSGLRIVRAGDDAAGLAISEKMRAQIRGLQQASRNAQDGISLIQTAEGALSEVHSILQRMRELATQAANDTNVEIDRSEIQKEINQLTSEINRIGNTTEFNTQKLLRGDGTVNLAGTGFQEFINGPFNLSGGQAETYGAAVQSITFTNSGGTTGGDVLKFTLDGIVITLTSATGIASGTYDSGSVTSTSATFSVSGNIDNEGSAIKSALEAVIAANDSLRGKFTVAYDSTTDNLTITSDTSAYHSIGALSGSGDYTFTGGTAAVSTVTPAVAAAKVIDLDQLTGSSSGATQNNIKALVGKGMTINGQQIEFYNALEGAYTGEAFGVDISQALTSGIANTNIADIFAKSIANQVGSNLNGVVLTASGDDLVIRAATAGTAGNSIEVSDGGVQQQYKATFQVGANMNQSFTIDINDMRSRALGITAAAGSSGYTASNTVTDGTSSTLREAALDVSTFESATKAINIINSAIEKVSAERSKLGAFQNRLEHTINNLGTSAENLTAAESRIRDVDMAKEMMEFTKLSILQQAATAMLAQANQQPQAVLQLLR